MSIDGSGANASGDSAVRDWIPRKAPERVLLGGRLCRLAPLDPSGHVSDLFAAFAEDGDGWTYLPYGPFDDEAQFGDWCRLNCAGDDPLFFSIFDSASGQAVGMASFLRAVPDMGVIEVGHIHFSPRLQRTTIATEAMYLMMRYVFDELSYRRYEWKCDARNDPSRRAAERLGFTFEGVFRQHLIYKGRNRDTAWYSVIDSEWPDLRARFEAWLNPGNFDEAGKQRSRLGG